MFANAVKNKGDVGGKYVLCSLQALVFGKPRQGIFNIRNAFICITSIVILLYNLTE